MIDGRNSVMGTAKVYYPYLDVLKGIAILLMVMGHVIPWTLDKSFIHQPVLSLSGNEFYLSLVYKIIYSFHIPLLFLSLAFIGRNSMEIYLLHSFFVMIFKEVGVYMISLNSLVTCVTFQIVYSFVLSVIAITLSILMANFLKGSSILKKLLFGL